MVELEGLPKHINVSLEGISSSLRQWEPCVMNVLFFLFLFPLTKPLFSQDHKAQAIGPKHSPQLLHNQFKVTSWLIILLGTDQGKPQHMQIWFHIQITFQLCMTLVWPYQVLCTTMLWYQVTQCYLFSHQPKGGQNKNNVFN